MAEGGEDIPLDPLDPDKGEDDHNDDQHETSFGGVFFIVTTKTKHTSQTNHS